MKKHLLILIGILMIGVPLAWASFVTQFAVTPPVSIGTNNFPVPTAIITTVYDPASYGNYSVGVWKTKNGSTVKVGLVQV